MLTNAHGIYKAGTHLQVCTWKADELIGSNKAKEYTGPWPPKLSHGRSKNKTKFNLKDLR